MFTQELIMKMRFAQIGVSIAALILMVSTAATAQEYSNWSTAVNVGSVINTAANDQHPTLSKDGLTMIFVSTRAADRAATTSGSPSATRSTIHGSRR